MANISFSSPFIRGFTHQDHTASTLETMFLAPAVTPERRVIVIVQNKSTTAMIQVILSESGSVGIAVPPLGNISLDNYNGAVSVISTEESPIHIAYAVC